MIHVVTNVALHSHNVQGGMLSDLQQEVTGYTGRDYNDFWTAQIARDRTDNINNGNNNRKRNGGNRGK